MFKHAFTVLFIILQFILFYSLYIILQFNIKLVYYSIVYIILFYSLYILLHAFTVLFIKVRFPLTFIQKFIMFPSIPIWTFGGFILRKKDAGRFHTVLWSQTALDHLHYPSPILT